MVSVHMMVMKSEYAVQADNRHMCVCVCVSKWFLIHGKSWKPVWIVFLKLRHTQEPPRILLKPWFWFHTSEVKSEFNVPENLPVHDGVVICDCSWRYKKGRSMRWCWLGPTKHRYLCKNTGPGNTGTMWAERQDSKVGGKRACEGQFWRTDIGQVGDSQGDICFCP